MGALGLLNRFWLLPGLLVLSCRLAGMRMRGLGRFCLRLAFHEGVRCVSRLLLLLELSWHSLGRIFERRLFGMCVVLGWWNSMTLGSFLLIFLLFVFHHGGVRQILSRFSPQRLGSRCTEKLPSGFRMGRKGL